MSFVVEIKVRLFLLLSICTWSTELELSGFLQSYCYLMCFVAEIESRNFFFLFCETRNKKLLNVEYLYFVAEVEVGEYTLLNICVLWQN